MKYKPLISAIQNLTWIKSGVKLTIYSRNGFKYELTSQDVKENDTYNRKFQVSTPEMELLVNSYKPISKDKFDKDLRGHVFGSTTEILHWLSEEGRFKLNQRNLTKALKFYGFEKKSIRRGKDSIPNNVWIMQSLAGEVNEMIEDEESENNTSSQSKNHEEKNGYPNIWD